MKEKIKNKIEEIVDHIISKPVSEVTLDDYTILANEFKEICYQESNAEHGKRMADLMAFVANPNLTNGIAK